MTDAAAPGPPIATVRPAHQRAQPDRHPGGRCSSRRSGSSAAIGLLWRGGGPPGGRGPARGALHRVAGFGVTIGFHRLFTHPLLRGQAMACAATLAILGSMSVQGAVIHGSPTTASTTPSPTKRAIRTAPTARRTGLEGGLTGLWHSHMGWLFDGEPQLRAPLRARPAQGPADPQDRQPVPGLGRCSACAPVRPGLARRAAPGARPDGARVGRPRARLPAAPRDLERQLDLPHVRQAAVRDRGREPQQLGRRARLARRGLAPHPPRVPDVGAPRPRAGGEIDVSYWFIRALALAGLAWDVKVPNAERIARRAARGPRPHAQA